MNLFASFEQAVEHLRRSLHQHPLRIALMSALDDLIAEGKKLIDARASAVAEAATEKARADKAEADLETAQSNLAALQSQVAADESKAAAAAAAIQAEVAIETHDTVAGGGSDTISGAEGNDSVVSGETVHG